MPAAYDIGASASTAISSQSGAAQSGTGEFNVTFGNHGGGLGSLLPLPVTPAGQAWVVWIVLGVVAVLGFWIWRRHR